MFIKSLVPSSIVIIRYYNYICWNNETLEYRM